MSKVDAHWELIPEIKKLRDEVAPHTLLTIKGDISDRQTSLKLAEQYGVDGIMIGRGTFHNQYSVLELRSFRPLQRFFKKCPRVSRDK